MNFQWRVNLHWRDTVDFMCKLVVSYNNVHCALSGAEAMRDWYTRNTISEGVTCETSNSYCLEPRWNCSFVQQLRVFMFSVGLDKIECLQLHSSDRIYRLAGRIIGKYFSDNSKLDSDN